MNIRSRFYVIWAALVLLIAAALIFGRGLFQKSSRYPNIIFISLDTTRADHLSCYGYHRETSPNIDKIASEGVLFRHAISPASWTLPSHASMFTGLYPSQHGAHYTMPEGPSDDFQAYNRLPEDLLTLPEILRQEGYETAGVIGGATLTRVSGIAQGFNYYKDEFEHPHVLAKKPADKINKDVQLWFQTRFREPFFLFVNYFDPHGVYLPPPPFDKKFAEYQGKPIPLKNRNPGAFKDPRVYGTDEFASVHFIREDQVFPEEIKQYRISQYDGEIAFMDHHIGLFMEDLKRRGLYDDALIILVGDHGEHFGEHNILGHGSTVYEATQHVPLIIKFPAADDAQKGEIDYQVGLSELFPFIINYLGIHLKDGVRAENLFRKPDGPIFAEQFGRPDMVWRYGEIFDRELVAVYYQGLKLIWNSRGGNQLFDLGQDPKELQDIIADQPELSSGLEKMVQQWLDTRSELVPTSPPENMSEELKDELRSLGYIE